MIGAGSSTDRAETSNAFLNRLKVPTKRDPRVERDRNFGGRAASSPGKHACRSRPARMGPEVSAAAPSPAARAGAAHCRDRGAGVGRSPDRPSNAASEALCLGKSAALFGNLRICAQRQLFLPIVLPLPRMLLRNSCRCMTGVEREEGQPLLATPCEKPPAFRPARHPWCMRGNSRCRLLPPSALPCTLD
jgi:hypothetical protein